MKTLTLVRHAKSSWKDPSREDRDRPLSARGKAEAPEMGRRLASRGVEPDAIVTSPARRARSTARKIARELGYSLAAILEDEALYGASLPELLAVVRRLDAGWGDALLVGHNPGFTELANFLGGKVADDLPTCAAVCLRFRAATWAGVRETGGELLFLDSPKDAPRG